MPDDTATDPTPTGPTPAARKKAAKAAAAPQPKPVDAGQRLLDLLAALSVEPTDPALWDLCCIQAACAMHIPAGARSTVVLLNPPADEGDEIEIRATTAEAAAQIVAALPWKNPPIDGDESLSTSRQRVTRGVLWGRRVAVVGVEILGEAW